MVHSAVDSTVIIENPERKSGYESTNAYYDRNEGKLAKSIKNPLNYSFIFFLAIPLGASLGYSLIDKKNDSNKSKITKPKNLAIKDNHSAKDYIPAFISGFLLLYGARMAGGCTSGHMMSGIMQSSVSGFIFAAAVFAVAIPVSILTAKKVSTEGVKS